MIPHFLTGAIVHLQVACDAKWEEALQIQKGKEVGDQIAHWMATATQDVAVEAFLPVEHGLAFFGVRLIALTHQIQSEIVSRLAADLRDLHEMNADVFAKQVEALANCSLFTSIPQSLEIGKVNAWRSFGAVKFWPDELARDPMAGFRNALKENPRFLLPSHLPYAIEFEFGGYCPHWYAYPISHLEDGVHRINDEAVSKIFSFPFLQNDR